MLFKYTQHFHTHTNVHLLTLPVDAQLGAGETQLGEARREMKSEERKDI